MGTRRGRVLSGIDDSSVFWQSTYLYAGTGPLLDAADLAGVAALGAGMGFDIYQLDEDADNGSSVPEA